MQASPPDFRAVLSALNAGNVRFVLIGGLAMTAYGSAHITQDIDVCYARDNTNLAMVAQTLSAYHVHLRGAPKDLPFVFDVRTLKSGQNFTLETDLGPIDVLGEVAGIASFDELWQRSVTMELYGQPVHVASLEDLIAMKRAANRPKDQQHLLELLALRDLIQSEEEKH